MSDAHRVMAFIKMSHEWDWAGAEAGFRKALSLSPGSALCHWSYSLCLVALCRFDEAIACGLQARAIDPLWPHIHNDLGSVYWMARRHTEAVESFRRALELDPQLVQSRRELGLGVMMFLKSYPIVDPLRWIICAWRCDHGVLQTKFAASSELPVPM